jgi:hypothetical protein
VSSAAHRAADEAGAPGGGGGGPGAPPPPAERLCDRYGAPGPIGAGATMMAARASGSRDGSTVGRKSPATAATAVSNAVRIPGPRHVNQNANSAAAPRSARTG